MIILQELPTGIEHNAYRPKVYNKSLQITNFFSWTEPEPFVFSSCSPLLSCNVPSVFTCLKGWLGEGEIRGNLSSKQYKQCMQDEC